jgi:hypothetical protein
MRIIKQAVNYDTDYFVDENTLYRNQLVNPIELTQAITYLWGTQQGKSTPLLNYTLGQNGVTKKKPTKLNDTRYRWPVMGRMELITVVDSLVQTLTKPGVAGTTFDVLFRDGMLHAYYTLYSPSGIQLRVNYEPTRVGELYRANVTIMSSNSELYVPLGDFISGTAWGYGVPTIPASKSDGTASNRVTPGEATNQFGFYRFSNNIAGNIANKVTEIEFTFDGAPPTRLWMPEEMRQFEWQNSNMIEHDLWKSEYNRTADGRVTLLDPTTNEPVPKGAGVFETVVSVGNYDTYFNLTLDKLDGIVNYIYDHRTDDTPSELVLYTGAGGKRMFNDAVMRDSSAKGFFTPLGDKFITGGDYLRYGAYFNQYKTINDVLLTVQETDYFNHGTEAQMDRRNGRMYNGHPFYSYNMAILDHSLDSTGGRNIEIVVEEGREKIVKIYEGMSTIPAVWGPSVSEGSIARAATKKDIASYEVIMSMGINFKNPYTSFFLNFSAD